MAQPTVLIAGASGDLGARIAKALVARGATVVALVRTEVTVEQRERLVGAGLTIVSANVSDVGSVAAACEGARCVVSALNGLYNVIVGRQSVLLDGAVKAGVPRFIPSDFSADFTKTQPGHNRNFDLRREFMVMADRAPIKSTSILNGAFMDMLGAEMPIIQKGIRRVLYWGSADQQLDFTTKDNVAAFRAAAALDDTTPRILRIAGDTVSARDIARLMGEVSGERYRTLWAGSIGALGVLIPLAKTIAPQPHAVFPPWQGMQYMRDMFSGHGQLQPLDNDRYPDLRWTSVREQLAAKAVSALRKPAP
jgi:nucleoside-diphosphate-sugar epimerase